MTESFPLSWPIGQKRTAKNLQKISLFKTTMGKSRDELLNELKKLGASNVVISTNLQTYRRGGIDIPYADQPRLMDDPGVAVYYFWKGEQYVVACDKFNRVHDNMQAINKTIDAIRGIERWGTGEMMKAAFSGFKALPEGNSNESSIWSILGMKNPTKNAEHIRYNYKSLAFHLHPDRGGSTERFQELNEAYQKALEYANS